MYGTAIEPTKGGRNIGTDIAIPVGTELAVPTGEWKVIDTKTGVKGGNITDYKKTPYGNSIFVQNTQTGEKLRFSHLSQVDVSKGDIIDTGTYIGKSGATGNVTGAHLDLEYYTSKGTLADVMKSAYGGYYTGEKNIEQTAGQAFSDFGKGASDVLSRILPNLNKEEVVSKEDFNSMFQ